MTTNEEPQVRLTDDEWFLLVSVADGLKVLSFGADPEGATLENSMAYFGQRLNGAVSDIRKRLDEEGICPKQTQVVRIGPMWTD